MPRQFEFEEPHSFFRTEGRIPGTDPNRHDSLSPETRFRLRLVEFATGVAQLHGHRHQLPLAGGEILRKASQVRLLDLPDPRLKHTQLLGQPLLLGLNEVETLLGDLDAFSNMLVNKILREGLGHLARHPLVVVREIDLKRVDVCAFFLPPGRDQGPCHGDDRDVLAHQRDDRIPGHLLGLLLVEIEFVDQARKTGATQDLGCHQVQPGVQIPPRHAALHELPAHGRRLHQHGRVAGVFTRKNHCNPIAHEKHQDRRSPHDGCAPSRRAGEIDLDSSFDVQSTRSIRNSTRGRGRQGSRSPAGAWPPPDCAAYPGKENSHSSSASALQSRSVPPADRRRPG